MRRMILAAMAAMAAMAVGPAAAQDIFTTPEGAGPILEMTKANWVAVREFDGQDLIYFTHLATYRCALEKIRFSVNGGKMQVWQPEPCYWDENPPFAMRATDVLPYVAMQLNSIDTVRVDLEFTDGSRMAATFDRAGVQIN